MNEGIVFLTCEVCGCSNLSYKEICDCTLDICGCYAHRTNNYGPYFDHLFAINDEEHTDELP